jgi:hypothetical protein
MNIPIHIMAITDGDIAPNGQLRLDRPQIHALADDAGRG